MSVQRDPPGCSRLPLKALGLPQLRHYLLSRVPPARHPHSHSASQRSHTNWTAIREADKARSPRKFSPQRALNEPEARLGQHDEYSDPGDITDYRGSERMEYLVSRREIPEIDRIRPLAQPPHWAACQQ